MVFKPFSHLARHGFAKTFPHGYAQSLVAGAQSSYASPTTPFTPFSSHSPSRYGKTGSSQLQNAFQNIPSSSTNSRANVVNSAEYENDGGLDAYFAAWQKHQGSGEQNEWKQFQFTKRIGWKAPSGLVDGRGKEKDEVLHRREGLDRSYSTSVVDDMKKAEIDVNAATEALASVKVNAAIANEITELRKSAAVLSKDSKLNPVTVFEITEEPSQNFEATVISPPDVPLHDNNSKSMEFSLTGTQSVSEDLESCSFTDQINVLSQSQQYREIPSVFESMLRSSARPTTQAYNGLLQAAIHLPTAKHQIIPKVLDVYSDMLRRKVLPDISTYTILLDLLSTRATDIINMRNNLEQTRLRFGGMQEEHRFMLTSQEAEYEMLADDDTLSIAMKVFNSSISGSQQRTFSSNTYYLLINACAIHGKIDDMIRVCSHMESQKVLPFASMFPPMIEAFAKSGDLRSAVECYNGYKSLAIADDNGKLSIIQRRDSEVYAAVIKAYSVCGKASGADRFFGKIVDSFKTLPDIMQQDRLQRIQNVVTIHGLIEAHISRGSLSTAFDIAETNDLTSSLRLEAMNKICSSAADNNDIDIAEKSYTYISSNIDTSPTGAIAMLAMYVRQGDVDSARSVWATLSTLPLQIKALVEPTAMYAISLIGSGHVDEGLMQARQSFARIRSSVPLGNERAELIEHIDECIHLLGSFLAQMKIFPTPEASMSFMWAMVENGGLVSPVTEHLLAALGPSDIAKLSGQDLNLALQVEAGIIDSNAVFDPTHIARFSDLLDLALVNHIPLDQRTSRLVEKSLGAINLQRPDLMLKWQDYQRSDLLQGMSSLPRTTHTISVPILPLAYDDSRDPFAATTDFKGSTIITEELERHGVPSSVNLNEALSRFRNMRRAGRHPRYIVYARLISAAAKDGRANLIHDILGMAKQDMPMLPQYMQYRVVRHGWASILDSMIGACLTLGHRGMAAKFHQELLDLGTAPSANTFGLYITTLKESTKTFDEATEAVKIFHRAHLEGVEPSSFLYNALIGKLGKARRIDDCMYFFSEMRDKGIRPTSVTYGTIVNALCRVSDEKFAQELFDEMESMPNYKPRPAPYNSLMQFFLTTKRDRSKVFEYYQRMQSRKILPTMHTYKLLIDTYATLDPIDMAAAEGVLDTIRASGQRPEAVHYASLIHAKGCALHDLDGARKIFDDVMLDTRVRPQACLYQALFESMVANHSVKETSQILQRMSASQVEMTPYIANTLIHGWATEKDVMRAKSIYDSIGRERREPSTYEAMTRAFLAVDDRNGSKKVVDEMLSRGYPSAVSGKIQELHEHGARRANSFLPSSSTPDTSIYTPLGPQLEVMV
ncbi:hypothetical protein MMC14_001738 [Varicellaria rhodocarpa]|nr:hypothetical protein [Varicellaria rhodocarpa]